MVDFFSFMFSLENVPALGASAYIIYIIIMRLMCFIDLAKSIDLEVGCVIVFSFEMLTWNSIALLLLCDGWFSVIVPVIFVTLSIIFELWLKNNIRKRREIYSLSEGT